MQTYARLKNIIFIYLLASITCLFYWEGLGRNSVTGDEPHYLVMASGIVNHGAFEQTLPYRDEFDNREIFKAGLASLGAEVTPENTHATMGPHGLYNVHNVGLPLLLAVPFGLGGVLGGKIFMVLIGMAAVVVLWKISGNFSENEKVRFWSVLAIAISLPLIPAAGQIYPDIVAGSLVLLGLYWLLTINEKRRWSTDLILAALIAYLPWLQIKFGPVSVVLISSICLKLYFSTGKWGRSLLVLGVAIFSCVLLLFYNYYAFGKISGPYQNSAVEFSKTSLMVLLGLFLDQNQGFLLQSPIMIVGVFFIGRLWGVDKIFCFILVVVLLLLIVPNALHPNWYGGGSFSGRFAWAAALVFWVPTVFGLTRVAVINKRFFYFVVLASLILQSIFYFKYVFGGADLYNKLAFTPFFGYSIFYYPFDRWLPAFYNSEWAYSYGVNFVWVLLLFVIFSIGLPRNKVSARGGVVMLVASLPVIVFAGFVSSSGPQSVEFLAKDLPSLTGHVHGNSREALTGEDAAGYVSYGPYVPLRSGRYNLALTYSSPSSDGMGIGVWDVANAKSQRQLKSIELVGTDSIERTVQTTFDVDEWSSSPFEFRVFWEGKENIRVNKIELERIF